MRRTVLTVFAFLLFAPAAIAQTQPTQGDEKALAAMTPQQREAAVQQAAQKYQSMTPQEQHDLQAQARRQWDGMSPAQKQAAEQEAAKQWNAMTPEQQDSLRQEFPGLLGGAAPASP